METDIFYQEILQALKQYQVKDSRLYGWTATVTRTTSYQRLLYSGPENDLVPQTLRDEISELSYGMTLYVRHGEPVVMGHAGGQIDPARELIPQIAAVLENALVVSNPPWDLVSPAGELGTVKTVEPGVRTDPAGTADRLVSKADATCRSLEGVNVNYAELFVNYRQSRTVTSTGLVMPSGRSDIYFEVAMEKLPLPNRQEIHNKKEALTVDDLQIEAFLRQAAEESRWLGEVVVPETSSQAVILVHRDVINQIFHCLLDQLNAGREYLEQPHLKIGEAVHAGEQTAGADPVTVRLDPALPWMVESTPFTPEGLPPLAGTVIADNVVMERYVSHRMSQYLDYPCHPVTGNVVLTCGSRSYAELVKAAPRVIEIISFSSLLLNSDSLTYSSEIKLAREFDNTTGQVRFLKGGVVSGNIRENLAGCLFSDREVSHNFIGDMLDPPLGYRGPEYMLIRSGVAIAGE